MAARPAAGGPGTGPGGGHAIDTATAAAPVTALELVPAWPRDRSAMSGRDRHNQNVIPMVQAT